MVLGLRKRLDLEAPEYAKGFYEQVGCGIAIITSSHGKLSCQFFLYLCGYETDNHFFSCSICYYELQ